MNILIIAPDFNALGGVSNHYKGLDHFWDTKNKISYIKCLFVLNINQTTYKIPAFFAFPLSVLLLTFKLLTTKVDLVIVNPSLRPWQVFREGVFLLISRLFKKKVITFFHGWDYNFSKKLETRNKIFNFVFNKSLFIYVLYSDFKNILNKIGVYKPILLTTTKVDDSLLPKHFEEKTKVNQILFLARIEKNKGISIVLDSFKIIVEKYPHLKLVICGNGSALKESIAFVEKSKIPNVVFTGFIKGKKISDIYLQSDIYILPTYEEGMATSILEAMAFGLPIISRPVGGINDYFQESKMGFLINSFEPNDFVEKISFLIDNPLINQNISNFNYHFAKNNFYASQVCKKIENDIIQQLNETNYNCGC